MLEEGESEYNELQVSTQEPFKIASLDALLRFGNEYATIIDSESFRGKLAHTLQR